jgi:hypothetical protein
VFKFSLSDLNVLAHAGRGSSQRPVTRENLIGGKMYLDPGTGSVIIQAVLAAVLSVGVFVRIFWKRIRVMFGKKDMQEPVAEETKEP